MSGKQTGKVWELDLPHNQLWMLQALADNAHHDGSHCFPGDELLAWKTGYDVRTVKRLLKVLREAGFIEVVNGGGGGRGRRTEYQLHLDRAPQKAPFEPGWTRRKKGDRTPPMERVATGHVNGDNRAQERVAPSTLKGDTPGARVSINRQEPLDGSAMEPSMRAPARAELATTNSGGEGHPPVLRITKGMSPRARDRLIRTAERTGARLIHESSNGAHQHES